MTHFERQSASRPGDMMKRIKVLIIDEHAAVRRALAARLESFPNIEVVAKAGSFYNGLDLAQTLRPDIILLELKGLRDLLANPIGDIHQALVGHPAGIIILTSYADGDEREAALQAGASRYLLKHIDTAQLLAEIEAVAGELANQAS